MNPPRFHKGLSSSLRTQLRGAGMQVDEELAQKLLKGRNPITSDAREWTAGIVANVLAPERFVTMRRWEAEHPDTNPFARSFAERIEDIAARALDSADEGLYQLALQDIVTACRRELDDDDYDD